MVTGFYSPVCRTLAEQEFNSYLLGNPGAVRPERDRPAHGP